MTRAWMEVIRFVLAEPDGGWQGHGGGAGTLQQQPARTWSVTSTRRVRAIHVKSCELTEEKGENARDAKRTLTDEGGLAGENKDLFATNWCCC